MFYQFKIKYKSEKNNGRADILNQQLNIIEEKKDKSHNILKKNKNNLLNLNNNIIVKIIIIKVEIE